MRFALAAVACGLLAGWLTLSYTARAEKQAGPSERVLVATAPIERGVELSEAAGLATRSVPSRYAPPDALTDPADAIGERLLIPVSAGAYLTRGVLSGGEQPEGRFKLRANERALTVDVVVAPAGEQLSAGDRIDLYASGYGGNQRTEALITRAEVLDSNAGTQNDRARATIRLSSDQVAAVVRADVFAHELRAVLSS